MSEVDNLLQHLRDEAWQLAVKCRDEEDTEAFKVLLEIDKRLADLLRGRSHTQKTSADGVDGLVTIFSPDRRHTAKLDPKRWTKQKASKCVWMNGSWMSLSGAAVIINGYQTRGPKWWHYEDGGQLRPVSALKPF